MATRPRPDGRHGVVNVRFVTLADLAEELGAVLCRGGGRRKVTRASLGAAARVALRSHRGFLAKVADEPSTEDELVSLYEELRQLEEGAVRSLGSRGRRGAELAALCSTMRACLEPCCFDDADLIDAAVRELDEGASLAEYGGRIVVHLPERARPGEARLVAKLAERTDLVVHLGLVGEPAADEPAFAIGRAFESAGIGGASAQPGLTVGGLGPDAPITPGERIEAGETRSEVRAAVRVVLDALTDGVPAARIAVLYSSRETYHQLMARALDAAGIAWSGPSATRVIETPTARALVGLIKLAGSGLERGAVLDWLRSAPFRGADAMPLPVGAWELASRQAGIVGGNADEWRRHLQALSRELDRGIGDETESTSTLALSEVTRRDRARNGLDACQSLAEFIVDLAERVDLIARASTWKEFVAASRAALEHYFGSSAERAASSAFGAADLLVEQVLRELEALDAVGDRAQFAAFVRALEGALERAFTYEGNLSAGVVVDDLARAIGLDFDVCVVLGAVEGELPGRARSSPLLGAADREAVGLDAATARAVVERDRRRLLGAIASTQRAVVSWRARDVSDGRARVRSRFIGDQAAAATAPSGSAALVGVADGALAAIDRAEIVAASLVALRGARADLKRSHLVTDSTALAASVAASASRHARAFDRFAGHVGAGSTFDATARAGLSPTTLQKYAECPFRFFLSRELSVEVVGPPERRLTIDPLERGSIAHEILERFVEELIRSNDPGRGGEAGSPERLVAIADDVFDRYERLGRTGARSLWRRERRRLLRVLEDERERDARRRASGENTPIAVEWSFGTDPATPVSFDLAQRTLSFRGKVDRIDRLADGSLAVIDYKTGSSWRFGGLRGDPVDAGRHLQLVVYALAARAALDGAAPITAVYRFLDEATEVPVEFDAATIERAREVLEVIVDGIESGQFPFYPGERINRSFSNCRYCDFDRVCPPDRDLFWAVARNEDRLGGFVALVEEEPADA